MDDNLDQNGYVDVHDLIKSSAAAAAAGQHNKNDVDVISQLISNQFAETKAPAASPVDDAVKLDHVVLQEPDSTTNEVEKLNEEVAKLVSKITEEKTVEPPTVVAPARPAATTTTTTTSTTTSTTSTTTSTSGCSYCAYCERLLELIYFHPKVDEILTWKDPKTSGALLAVLLVTLISLASFSLLSITGFLLLAAMSLVGGYRLYVAILTRIKGQTDDCLSKFVSMKLRVPKEDLQQFVSLAETHGNVYLNKLKEIVLWENLTQSAIAYGVAYVVYSIGCAFNTLTLLILLVLFAFSWPKVYRMYKVQIDQAVKKAHDQSVELLSKIKEKVPFLNKKKLQ